ncbi:hypothetical protein, partial [Pseudomonas syringae]|uniref:hypothetical protein n=1 Tax=Pseudomonas syringae TaxID=317 RepID=UPI001C9BB08E
TRGVRENTSRGYAWGERYRDLKGSVQSLKMHRMNAPSSRTSSYYKSPALHSSRFLYNDERLAWE